MLSIKDLCKQYKTGDLVQQALDHVNLDLRDNEFVAILGTSGSGKTTLLNMIGGLDRYDKGDLIINGISTKQYKELDWDAYRNHTIGFVFQSYNLIMHQSVLSNVELAMTLSGISKVERKKRALAALDKVGLKEQAHKKPNQMSGGQMQRVAIARALVNEPEIILADEPTGALDSSTSIQIMDILKDVAKDRLVVMVTHNPDLAKDYATRIVELKDGKIISDSNPVDMREIEYKTEKVKRTKLGFKTALGLSLNNLMTKKGRTILTAFAGAIGIIGIALILSLSNGVNDYIASIESETMGSYPIELEKETMNFSGILEQGGSNTNKQEEHDNDSIYSDNIVKDSLEASSNTTIENDLGKFKVYLEENKESIKGSISSVEYGYNISPIVIRKDVEDIVKVSPSYLTDLTSSRSMSGFKTTSSVWTQIATDQNLRKTQYELLEGKWPKEKNEIALIISSNNDVSDYILYTLGLLDYSELKEMIEAIENGEDYDNTTKAFSYNDVLNLEYQVFAPCELYKEVDNVWVDKSNDEDYLLNNLKKGLTVKITAVLKATDEADISSGVAYTEALTDYLIDTTVNSKIVKEQLNNPKVNILTGEEFEKDEERNDTANATNSLFQGKYETRLMSSYHQYLSSTQLLTNTTDNIEYKIIFYNDDGSVFLDGTFNESDDLSQVIEKEPTKDSSTPTITHLFIGWLSSDGQYYLTKDLPKVSKNETYTALYYDYKIDLGNTNTPGINDGDINIGNGDMSMPNVDGIGDLDGFTSGGNIELSDDQLSVIMAQINDDTPSTYEDVLETLGYCTKERPSSIALYPTNFEGKEAIESFIEQYNNQVENDYDKVTYTDMVGTLTSSITSIVDMISYVLIAFVAISLVVSSIMIAIITYISVLERTKEIGVLRALGASKKDVSKIFNAETFIEGFISGVLGIVTTLLLCIPVDSIVYNLTGVDNIASLPMEYSILLIGVSILLTVIAGIIPSRTAAKKDPVISLRSE